MSSLCLVVSMWLSFQPPAEAAWTMDWGTIRPVEADTGLFEARLTRLPSDPRLPLPKEFPLVVSAGMNREPPEASFPLEIPAGTSEIWLVWPQGLTPSRDRSIRLETTTRRGQLPDGRMVWRASDLASSENSPAGDPASSRVPLRLPADHPEGITWKFPATRPGSYFAEVLCALEGEQAAELELSLGDKSLRGKLTSTGRSDRFETRRLGRVTISQPGTISAHLRLPKEAPPVHLLAVTLRPAPEGKAIAQAEDGSITCHARDVTIQGVQVQYEPKPEKNTVGFWTNPRDQVSWEFTLHRPGKYSVEILQGCGKGQGGSEVELLVDKTPLRFVVEDTGHFQNFVERTIGTVKLEKPGQHHILVRPLSKPGVAVMDLRQVRLVPVK